MSDAPPELDRLARNVKKILTEAGIVMGNFSSGIAGARVVTTAWGVEVSFATGDYLEPSYTVAAEEPRHRNHPLLMFRRAAESIMLNAYVAVLHAAGFTVMLRPADEDDVERLIVTAGPLDGIDPIQEIKDLHDPSR